MKIVKIADQIIKSMCREFVETGNEFSSGEAIACQFPDEPRHIIFAAVRMLNKDGLLSVSYADDEPNNIALNVSAVRQCEENTMLKKGYNFVKEIRSWF